MFWFLTFHVIPSLTPNANKLALEVSLGIIKKRHARIDLRSVPVRRGRDVASSS